MRRTILPSDWELPDAILARLGSTVGRQRAMFADGHLLLLLHVPPEPGEPERSERVFWRDPEGRWKSKGLGTGINALATHLDEYAAKIDGLEEQFEQYDGSEDLFTILRAVTPIQRALRHMHATLQQAREHLEDDQETIDARDRAGGLMRAVELLQSETKHALDYEIAVQGEIHAKASHQMNVSANRLNGLAAVFFPLVTLSGIFGMNLDSGIVRALGDKLGFWVVLGGGMLFGVVLYLLVSRRPALPRLRRS